MKYWEGHMNWPLDLDWVCEICGKRDLIWGLVNGQCRCNTCHAQYSMREDKSIFTRPVCKLKPEYHQAFKVLWPKLQTPVDEMTDADWDSVLGATAAQK